MKEQFTDDSGKNWQFVRWRIAPPGHPLPCPSEFMTHIPPEGIFVNEEGLEIGLHPDSPWTSDNWDYQPQPFSQSQEKLNSKARRKLRRAGL